MSTFATLPPGMTLLCIGAALLGAVGAWRHAQRGRVGLALLQLPLAVLLLLALRTSSPPVEARLLVLTAGASAPGATEQHAEQIVVALPGGPSSPAIESVPDLATALRRHPAVRHVRVIGRGLAEHDRAALGVRTLVYVPSPAPTATAFVALDAAAAVLPGMLWTVRGRVRGDAERIELLDPAGAATASVVPDSAGRFSLSAASRAPGAVLFGLRAMRGDVAVATLPLPVVARPGAAPRVLLLGALPTPDTKYLRRWAIDAGVELESRVGLAPTLVQRRGEARLDAATLAELDLLIVDERSWPQLSAQTALLREAIAGGLGLLVRITGPVPDRVAQEWRALGVDVRFEGDAPREVRLAAGDAALHAWPVEWRGEAAPPPETWRDSKGGALAAVLPIGQGRVGALWLTDSFRLQTRGTPERHATLWASLVGALARARAEPGLTFPELISPGRRAVLCGLRPETRLLDSAGDQTQFVQQGGCAAWWPRARGWHRVSTDSGRDVAELYVHDPADVAALLDQIDGDATVALANGSGTKGDRSRTALPGAAQWLAAWLLLMTLTWWLERRARHAARAPSTA